VRSVSALVGAVLLGAIGTSCRPRPAVAPGLVADTLRGVVQRVGPEPTATYVLQPRSGGPVRLEGAPSIPWQAALQLDVMVEGTRTGNPAVFAATRYTVRAVDGLPADDGVLVAQPAGRWALRRADGTVHPLREVPTALTRLAGARIYWVGPLDRAPQGYGVLVPP
jgi:hypothetical protein